MPAGNAAPPCPSLPLTTRPQFDSGVEDSHEKLVDITMLLLTSTERDLVQETIDQTSSMTSCLFVNASSANQRGVCAWVGYGYVSAHTAEYIGYEPEVAFFDQTWKVDVVNGDAIPRIRWQGNKSVNRSAAQKGIIIIFILSINYTVPFQNIPNRTISRPFEAFVKWDFMQKKRKN